MRMSTPQAQTLVQLRPGDLFMITSRRFSLAMSDMDQVQSIPSVSESFTVVDLEDEAEECTDVTPQSNHNGHTTGTGIRHPTSISAKMNTSASLETLVHTTPAEDQALSISEMPNGGVDRLLGTPAMEHPYRYPQGSADDVLKSILESAMDDKNDSQEWGVEPGKPDVMGRMREAHEQASTQRSMEYPIVGQQEGEQEADSKLSGPEQAEQPHDGVTHEAGVITNEISHNTEAQPVDEDGHKVAEFTYAVPLAHPIDNASAHRHRMSERSPSREVAGIPIEHLGAISEASLAGGDNLGFVSVAADTDEAVETIRRGGRTDTTLSAGKQSPSQASLDLSRSETIINGKRISTLVPITQMEPALELENDNVSFDGNCAEGRTRSEEYSDAEAAGCTSLGPLTSRAIFSDALVPPFIPKPDKQQPADAGESHSLAQGRGTPSPKAHERGQTIDEQFPKTHRLSEGVKQTLIYDYPDLAKAPTSASDITGTPDHESADTIFVGRPTLNTTLAENLGTMSTVPPQDRDLDTQNSTIARVDDLLQLAETDPYTTNSMLRPEGELEHLSTDYLTLTTDTEAGTEDETGSSRSAKVSSTGGEDAESGRENMSRDLEAFSTSGGSNVDSMRTETPNKRRLETPEKEATFHSKTSVKRRKTQDSDNSMESTVRLGSPSSRRNPTSTQTSLKEVRRVSVASAELSPSTRSRSATEDQETSATLYSGPPPSVLFSSNTTVDNKPHLMGFLNHQGGRKVDAVKDCNILCVGPGELRKTGKLLLAVALGKDVIKDKWLIDSARQGRLLPPTSYLAEDPDRETEWGVKLEDSVARGKLGVKPFAGWTIYFTPTLKKELGSGFLELKELALLVGANAVHPKIPNGAEHSPKTLVLASEHDKDASLLEEAGWTCYSKDVISLSILRGRFDHESGEFQIQPSSSRQSSGGKRKRR